VKVAIVQALWNRDITDVLVDGAVQAAEAAGVAVCERFTVAGAFELPAAAGILARSGRYDAVVPLGCLIRGETPHFRVLADAVAAGLITLSLTTDAAIPFGVLTCATRAQAKARAGGREGNKGAEFMDAALRVVALRQESGTRPRRSPASKATASSRVTRRRRGAPGPSAHAGEVSLASGWFSAVAE